MRSLLGEMKQLAKSQNIFLHQYSVQQLVYCSNADRGVVQKRRKVPDEQV